MVHFDCGESQELINDFPTENNMYGKTRILVHRIICTVALFIGIIVPIILNATATTGFEIVSDSGRVIDYDTYLRSSKCEVTVIFNKNVDTCGLTVAFYDQSGRKLDEKTDWEYGKGKSVTATFYYIDGKVDSYRIISFDAEGNKWFIYIFLGIDVIIFTFWICSWLLSCKVYNYNGKKILVYAGWFHHYIEVDGRYMDEHNTLMSFTPIELSCTLDDGTLLQARISLTNRISLKINNQLYR